MDPNQTNNAKSTIRQDPGQRGRDSIQRLQVYQRVMRATV